MHRFQILPSVLGLAIAGLIGGMSSVFAQQAIPVCQPPISGEYLLLVVSPTANNQKQLRSALPPELKTITCKYLNETVTRIGGFKKIDDANRWARYVSNIVGLSAIITTRPTTADVQPQQRAQQQAQQQPLQQTVNYNPQALGEGYAVLVDYYNRPELVSSVQQAVGGNVGFVSYGQRPYLLAVYTTNQSEAYNTLQKLNNGGFVASIVDSRKVILLRSTVRL
ncbi:hypothetical protein CDG77_32795 [Nostoc sp. 'Peltigera membranacea cyanobiont' 213]|uniref:hypothetical protein n=1 Tax=unclassified Nostoc TaxID=2593658 RepID=UPI000B95C52A|nr:MULTISPECIES: hypothetical protein [unclassified Nostoc]AVH64833.1 hypothetical protein NPM_3223 [Nostoc sp. 'Peltigera membranacea cyanobiont' N6]OYD86829.1 hypothetical protein CDG77_32795 [Nostoc sp. 'Peltigera membranacea cyanobiont' 213]